MGKIPEIVPGTGTVSSRKHSIRSRPYNNPNSSTKDKSIKSITEGLTVDILWGAAETTVTVIVTEVLKGRKDDLFR